MLQILRVIVLLVKDDVIEIFDEEGPYHLETSSLICRAIISRFGVPNTIFRTSCV